MAVITLTTDLGTKDYYVAALKGNIYKELPDVSIVDISHDIDKYNIAQAAFVIKNCFQDFPKSSIHILGVRPEKTESIDHVLAQYKGHFFVGADNGIFSLIFDHPPEKVVALNIRESLEGINFPTKDVFVKAACHIARGGTPEIIGNAKNSINERTNFAAVVSPSSIRGFVIYIYSYGNVITNITREVFNEVGKGRGFSIAFGNSRYTLNEIKNQYIDSVEGELLALFGSSGYLEIAICAGNAKELVGLHLTHSVTIIFNDR